MSATQVPADRYGPPATPARRRRIVTLIVVGALAGVALVVWLGLQTARPAVTWRDVGYTLDGDRAVTVDFYLIRADAAMPVTCRVHALNTHYGQVGVVTQELGPGEQSAQIVSIEIATTEQAVTAVVDRCWTSP